MEHRERLPETTSEKLIIIDKGLPRKSWKAFILTSDT